MSALDSYIADIDRLAGRLSRNQTARLAKQLAAELKKRNAARIRANVEPDGEAFAPRSGSYWQLRRLKNGETLSTRQKFNYFKEQNLSAAHIIRDDGEKIILRENGLGNPPYKASGFLRSKIYLKKRSTKPPKMFKKIGRHLKHRGTADGAEIRFTDGLMAEIAAEHHHGRDKLPARELLGFSEEDLAYIRQTIEAELSAG
ncbi:MAG: phage virion morphogenesis protein [Neisseria sp.]|nr:phage virion morphogenesis protein [Neisseria sp.]